MTRGLTNNYQVEAIVDVSKQGLIIIRSVGGGIDPERIVGPPVRRRLRLYWNGGGAPHGRAPPPHANASAS